MEYLNMPADILRTSVKISRTANAYEAVCLTCGATLGKSRNPTMLCAADREHMLAEHHCSVEAFVAQHGSGKTKHEQRFGTTN
jgi:hypothetical protein